MPQIGLYYDPGHYAYIFEYERCVQFVALHILAVKHDSTLLRFNRVLRA